MEGLLLWKEKRNLYTEYKWQRENENIIHQPLEEYDIQDVLKDLPGEAIKEMMEEEMDRRLGDEKSERFDSDDYRNGYKRKRVNSRYHRGYLWIWDIGKLYLWCCGQVLPQI